MDVLGFPCCLTESISNAPKFLNILSSLILTMAVLLRRCVWCNTEAVTPP